VAEQAFRITSEKIDFQIHLIPRCEIAQCRGHPSVWNHGDPKSRTSITAPSHREADAINGNTGFFTDVPPLGGIAPAQFEIPRLV
jgi:hypothetical protein